MGVSNKAGCGHLLIRQPVPYDSERAAWGRPKVGHLFSLEDGGIGAWEIAARNSTVDLDSNVIPGVSQDLRLAAVRCYNSNMWT